MDYTITNIAEDLDAMIQQRAQLESKSVNAVLIEAIRRGLTNGSNQQPVRDLSDIAGKCTIDETTRAIFDEQRTIDPDLWK